MYEWLIKKNLVNAGGFNNRYPDVGEGDTCGIGWALHS
jgi:hypothetical protein